MCRQQQDCYSRVEDVIRGSKGTATIASDAGRIEGAKQWESDKQAANRIDMYDIEHAHLFRSIREGKPINNGHYMANSTMLAIMGRMCGYTGQMLRWDECFNSGQQLAPSEYAWTDNVPESSVAIPGKTKLV
jgi:hypothetical protein